MIVTFWSPLPGRGCSSNCVATSLQWALNYNAKGLIISMIHRVGGIETAYLTEAQLEKLNREEYGIDQLERLLVVNNIIKEQEFKTYTKEIIQDRLDLLSGSMKKSRGVFEKCFENSMPKILKNAKENYDMVFVDANIYENSSVLRSILRESDVVVFTLGQNYSVINSLMSEEIYLNKKEKLLVIGRYDIESKYTKGSIRKKLKKRSNIFCVPNNTNFMDAFNAHSVKNYFESNNRMIKNDSDWIFFNEIYEIVYELERILEREEGEKSISFEKQYKALENCF